MSWETVGSRGYGRSSKSDKKLRIVDVVRASFKESFPTHIFLQSHRGRTRNAKFSIDQDE